MSWILHHDMTIVSSVQFLVTRSIEMQCEHLGKYYCIFRCYLIIPDNFVTAHTAFYHCTIASHHCKFCISLHSILCLGSDYTRSIIGVRLHRPCTFVARTQLHKCRLKHAMFFDVWRYSLLIELKRWRTTICYTPVGLRSVLFQNPWCSFCTWPRLVKF